MFLALWQSHDLERQGSYTWQSTSDQKTENVIDLSKIELKYSLKARHMLAVGVDR